MGETGTERERVLDERADGPGLLLALLGQRALRHLRAAHVASGLSPRQFHVLGLLHDHGAMGQKDLASELAVEASVVVGVLNPLEEDGLIERRRSAQDRRRHVVHLTDAGAARLQSSAAEQRAAEDEFFQGWPASRREELGVLLVELHAALDVGHDPPEADCAGTGPAG